MSSYTLGKSTSIVPVGLLASLRRLLPLVRGEGGRVGLAVAAVIVSSTASLLGPLIIGHTIDTYIRAGDYGGVLRWAALLLGVYLAGLVATYTQTLVMGTVGRRVLFAVRNGLFAKLQELPLDFFNQNKAGDLISRINNDTDKLNQFFAQSLVQLAGNLFMMAGAGTFLLSLNPRLGLVALAPAAGVLVVTRVVSPWVQRRNVRSLQSLGAMSGEIQESLGHFKVVVAFNRRDYFRRRFETTNQQNFAASVGSGLASGIFLPMYGLAYNLAQVAVLASGIGLIARGDLTIGLLVGFLLYVNSFYLPMRQLATIWASFQLALAALERLAAVLGLQSNLPLVPAEAPRGTAQLAFDAVAFSYPGGTDVLRDVSFALERGRTYALVGPTGGGKTTTASLMARLYDPTHGQVLLDGRDIRSFPSPERTAKIGFILQEPFLFSGTIRDNLVYGHDRYQELSSEALMAVLAERELDELVSRFPEGLETRVSADSDAISLGQKQVIAFIRAVLREPEILILDEATANIDTVTEHLLEEILARLPASTTKVIIAHRLNTIANADEIFFVNAGTVTPAGSLAHAVEMLLHGKRVS